jgi:hypothetical protein
MRRAWCWGFFLSCSFATGAAGADTVNGLRSEALKETAHRVQITLSTTHATLRVQRSVWNGGPRHDQATFMIDVPASSVATALATLGTKDGSPFWFRGELMEAEAAARKYEELTGIGGYYPKDPALLSWRDQSLLALQVFPCAPKASKWIEYTLEMPMHYASGRYFIELPSVGTDELRALASVHPARPGDRVFVDGEPFAPGGPFRLDRDEPLRIELEPRNPARFEGEFAAFEFAEQRVLTRLRVAAAPRISAVPAGARVVVLLDGSRSLDAGARRGAIAAAHAYLSRFPGASVELATFDRGVTPRHGRLVPVAQALRDLETLQIAPKNGSHLERALEFADALLSAPGGGDTKRVLVLTDARTRRALTPEHLARALGKSRALVHVGIVSDGGDADSLERDDEHALAAFTKPTGGLVWYAGVSAGTDPLEKANVFESWVRPTSVDRLVIAPSAEDVPDAVALREDEEHDALAPRSLREGSAFDWLGIAGDLRDEASVRGELWTEPVEVVFKRDEKSAKRWAALVFGTPVMHGLSELEMMVLARHGGAVSPVTSYLAIEPGVRPSTEGLEHSSGLGAGFGRLGGMGTSSRHVSKKIDLEGYLRSLLQQSLSACGGTGRTAGVEIETTLHEIVELSPVTLDGADDPRLAACVSERLWGAALPRDFTDESAVYAIRG